MKRILSLIVVLMTVAIATVSAKFLQEVELKDGTILVGYVYRQQPSKYIVFHVERTLKDARSKYLQHDKNYTLQWGDVKYIRRSPQSDVSWCNDRVTLKDGTVYIGQIEEQELGVSLTIRINETNKKMKVMATDLKISEKVMENPDKDIWLDRPYTNKLRLTDKSIREGLIVLQYRGSKTTDSYVELLHGSGYKERVYLPDIKEYIIVLQ